MRGWVVVAWTVILVAVSAFGALMGVLIPNLECGPPYRGTCDPRYALVISVPPLLVLAGALLTWRRRDYSWLICGAALAAAGTVLIWVLP